MQRIGFSQLRNEEFQTAFTLLCSHYQRMIHNDLKKNVALAGPEIPALAYKRPSSCWQLRLSDGGTQRRSQPDRNTSLKGLSLNLGSPFSASPSFSSLPYPPMHSNQGGNKAYGYVALVLSLHQQQKKSKTI